MHATTSLIVSQKENKKLLAATLHVFLGKVCMLLASAWEIKQCICLFKPEINTNLLPRSITSPQNPSKEKKGDGVDVLSKEESQKKLERKQTVLISTYFLLQFFWMMWGLKVGKALRLVCIWKYHNE